MKKAIIITFYCTTCKEPIKVISKDLLEDIHGFLYCQCLKCKVNYKISYHFK